MSDDGATDGPLTLASLLVARLCHELSGPLGTVLTATGMAAEATGEAGVETVAEALPLAAEAAGEIARRLRLLRAAWGNAGVAVDVAELRRLAEGLPGRRIHLEWRDVVTPGSFSAGGVQAILNLLLLAAESLPGGGEIALSGQPRGILVLSITGPQAAWPASLACCLADPSEAWRRLEAVDAEALPTARLMQAPLAALIAHRNRAKVRVSPASLAIDLSET